MSSSRARPARQPRLQRQSSVMSEIQESQEKENLGSRCARLMTELSGLCEDRNNVLTSESLEFLARQGRPEPIKLEREPEKVLETLPKPPSASLNKQEDLLSADAARRQRVEELTRFFMEAKSDIEFALGGSREFREARDKEKGTGTESERDDDKEDETGEEDEDGEKAEETMDPRRDAARFHARLLKDKVDERVYNALLQQIREQDAALYGAMLCHPLITGVNAKKDRRKKKKRKERERGKDRSTSSSSPTINAMLSPDFTAEPLTDNEMQLNISRFVARAIADGSLQGLMLAAKLVLAWASDERHDDGSSVFLPLVSHLRVLRGEDPPKCPDLPAKDKVSSATPNAEGDAAESVSDDVRGEIAEEVSAMQSTEMELETEGESTANPPVLADIAESEQREGSVHSESIKAADVLEEEIVDEDALMARAIALSLSSEMNLRDSSTEAESPSASSETTAATQDRPRPVAFSPDEIVELGPFILPSDDASCDCITVVVCLLSQMNKMCLKYIESCRNGILPDNTPVQAHPLTFMLLNSLMKDVMSVSPQWMRSVPAWVAKWTLFASCTMTSMLQVLEAHFFHVEVVAIAPGSIGLGHSIGQSDVGNRLVESLKAHVERCLLIDCDKSDSSAVNSLVFSRSYPVELVEPAARCYNYQVRENAMAAWTRAVAHFYPTQASRYQVLTTMLEDCLKFQSGDKASRSVRFHQLDLLCARLCLPDLAPGFVPPCSDIVVSSGEENVNDRGMDASAVTQKFVDDTMLAASAHQVEAAKALWSPELIRASLSAGSLSPRYLLDYLVEHAPSEIVENAGVTNLSLSDTRANDLLVSTYEQMWNAGRQEEREALECINRLPGLVDLLRRSVLQDTWANFSFVDDYNLAHAPLVPILEKRKRTQLSSVNARVLLLRALQDLMVQRLGGSRSDEPPALEFDPSRCAETMTLSDGNKTARQYTAKQWGMVMATTGCPPNSGVHEWAVRLDRCEKGHIFLGVCTRDASVATYVGGDRQGWGLIGTRALWHNRSKVRGDYGDGFSTGSIVRVRLNTDSGALSFGVEDSDWGIAFDGLTQHGTLYPAIGLYQRDDQVTLLPVLSAENATQHPLVAARGVREVAVPALLHPFLHHAAAIIDSSCDYLRSDRLVDALKQAQTSASTTTIEELIAVHPILLPLVTPLLGALSVEWNYHGLSSILALHFVPWCTKVVRLLDDVNKVFRGARIASGGEIALDVSGDWEIKSMAAGNIPAQQYHLVLMQEKDGSVTGRSAGSFTTVTLSGAVVGTKVRFVETWRQGGTCLVEGRLRADGNAFSGCFEDAKSHISGSIVGHKVMDGEHLDGQRAVASRLLVLEMVSANMVGYFCRFLIDCAPSDLIIENYSTLPSSDEEIVGESPSASDMEGQPHKPSAECSSDEYEGWVNSMLLSGGLPSTTVAEHLSKLLQRLTTFTRLELEDSRAYPLLAKTTDEWLRFVTPKTASSSSSDMAVSSTSDVDPFLQDLIDARGEAGAINRWISRHVGESPFARLGGEPMKVAKRTVCAAMIWHSGFTPFVKRILEMPHDNLVESEERPHENLMHIWRAAQRVIEWAIRAKNSMGSTYAVIAGLIIRKAQFLLSIEPSARAMTSSVAMSIISQDSAVSITTKSPVYESAERIYSEVLMQVSRFLEAPIRISNLQARMLAHSTRAFLRIAGMRSFRFFVGDVSSATLSEVPQSSFALATVIHWLSPSAVNHSSIVSMSRDADSSEKISGAIGVESTHYLSGLGGCGKYLKNDLRAAFEELYGLMCASLSRATWAHDADLQLVLLEAWGIVIQPDDHAFLSRVGIFRILQTVLDESRGTEASIEFGRLQESRRKVVQAALKVVHLLAAQVAHAGDNADEYVVSTSSSGTSEVGLGAIPLLRKPSGPETLGKSVFHMLYTELKNAVEELRTQGTKSTRSDAQPSLEPTEIEPGVASEEDVGPNDTEEYCFQICSLLYSVSGSPVCRSHLSSSRWLRLLLVLLDVGSVYIQRRTLKLLRRLLPELDPTSIKLRPQEINDLDLDSDEECDEDVEDQAVVLIRFFVAIVGAICPPSLAEAMLRKAAGSSPSASFGVDTERSVKTGANPVLASEVVLLLRSLYKSPKWSEHMSVAIVGALSALSLDTAIESVSKPGPAADSDIEMEDQTRELPSVQSWVSETQVYLEALSALCVLDGHIEGLRVGGTVKIMPKTSSSVQEVSFRGARGLVVSYEPEKSAAEVLLKSADAGESQSSQAITPGMIPSRPIRVPIEDLVPVPEVELNSSAFSDEVLRVLLVDRFPFFVDEIRKSLIDFPSSEVMKTVDGAEDVDEDDDMSNDGVSSPGGMDSEMASGGGAESDADSDVLSPKSRVDTSGTVEPLDVLSELERESKLHRMLLCQHGLRASAMLLRDPRAAAKFVQGVGPKGLMDLLGVSSSETTTAGLSEIGALEESWTFLWSRWFSIREASAEPPPVEAETKDEGSAESQKTSDLLNPMVQQMMEMGFPKEWCEVALNRCNQNVEAAINFCFEHSNDMERFVSQQKGSKESAAPRPKGKKTDAETPNPLLEQLAEMGFPVNWCKKALVANRNNVDAALTWILSNGEALEAEDRRDEESKLLSTVEQAATEPAPVAVILNPNPLRAVSGQASIGEGDLMVEGLVGGGFASVGAPDCVVSSGRWYYEAILHTNGCIQIGWADVAFCGAADRGDGVGDGVHSWAYDGWRQQKWHGQSSPWGSKWKQGDVVGCAIDVDAGSVIFSLNGKMRSANMGIAFRGIEYAHGLYPCASFNRRERLQFNLGGTPFKFPPPPGFRPILDVLKAQFEDQPEIPRGFAIVGSREDCLEENVGEENYSSDSRYFGRDLHPSMIRSSGSHSSRSTFVGGSTRADMFAELKAIPDDRVFAELLVLTRSLAILHARRAVLTIMSKWPVDLVGSFSMQMFSLTLATTESSGKDDAVRFLEFVKLIAGVSGQFGVLISNDNSHSSDVDEILDYGASGRVALGLLKDISHSAIEVELLHMADGAELASNGLTAAFLDRIGEEVKCASQRQYARVPWDSCDASVAASLMQISAENGQAWSDKEVSKHPNLFLAEWMTGLLLDALNRCSKQLREGLFDDIRSKLLNAWLRSLRSAGQCVKEKGFTIVAGILQEMVMKVSSSGGDTNMEPTRGTHMIETALHAISLDRMVNLADDRLLKEYSQLPVCSRYLQSVIELVSAGALAHATIGQDPNKCFRRDIGAQLAAAKKLEEDLVKVDLAEFEEETARKLRLTEEADAQAREASANALEEAPVDDDDGENEDQEMQEDNATPRPDGAFGSGMEIDSEAESGPDITLSAIANMVAEDSDVVAAAAAIAAAAKGRLSIRQTGDSVELKPPASDFEYVFPEVPIELDTSMLDEEETEMLHAGAHGVIGEEPLAWNYGSELGVMSDTTSSYWSGQITQFKLRGEEEEPTIPELTVGCKVIRGPNWKWRDQDGGDGSIGVVEGVSPWSGVEGEGMSVRWPNGSLYTYRWGADGNFDLIHVEADEEGNITNRFPTPKAKQDDEGIFGCELHLGVLLHLFEDEQTQNQATCKLSGVMEWPDFNAAVRVAGIQSEDGTLSIQELLLIRGNPDMGWMLRFGQEKWQAGTKYTLRPAKVTSDGNTLQNGLLVGEFTHPARKKAAIVQVQGEIHLSTKYLFKMDPFNHFSTLSVSDEGTIVTCNGGESRNLAIATVGFAVGIHYWEVRVDQAEFGSVFIGVCEKAGPPGSQAALSSRLNRWHGWGFVNFRATYHNSTERIYGDHFNAGDTIGVRLDMEQGKLSFFMDGMKFGEHIVADLGVAFENMKGERNSRTLYPCIGMRKSGDRVALNGKWMSVPGVSPRQLLRDAVDVSRSLHSWFLHVNGHISGPVPLSDQLLQESWAEWKRWSENRWQRYPVRPRGVLVDFDTLPSSCIAVSNEAGLGAPFIAGDRVRVCAKLGRELNQPEEAVILGVYREHLWYRTETQGNEGADEGRSWAWYFSDSELAELLLVRRNGKDMTLIENSATDLSEVMRDAAFVPRSEVEGRARDSFAAFVQLATQSHTPASDMQLVERLNTYCAAVGVEMTNLKIGDVITPGEEADTAEETGDVHAKRTRTQSLVPDDYFASPSLKAITGPELRARCAVLRVLNGKLSRALPLLSIQGSDTAKDPIQVANADASEWRSTEYLSTGLKVRTLRRLVFTATKRSFWDAVLRATTTSTPLPSDEYEDPREIRVIRINRIQAQASKLSLLAQPNDRLRRSVFGQLYREMRTWNDSSFRRAYCGKGHGGQRRAFKVKFLGEGVNDYGGPYRAVFEQVVDELQMDNIELSKGEQGLLPLLIPCPNRRGGTGSNQDKYLLNPSCGTSLLSNGPMALDLHRFLGKVIGTAVRHGLQMGLDLPSLIWRPLARLEVSRANLESVDVVAANHLARIEECDASDADDLLSYLTFSTTLSDGTEVALVPNGEHTPVTWETRQQFVRVAEKMRLTESATQLSALRDGLGAVLPMELAPLFTPRELEILICGRREVDVELLRQCTEYGEGVDESMPHVEAFWEVLREMTSDERTSFLRFVWARSRMPNSAKDFPMNFKIQSAHDVGAQVDPDLYLPHAQTCFFALRLPTYSCKEVLREKLLYAIQNSPNMDADVRLHNAEGWADA